MTMKEMEQNIHFFTKVHKAFRKNVTSVDELIFKKYIEFENIEKVKTYIQNEGIRTTRGTAYQSSDISHVLQSQPDHVDKFIVNLAHSMLQQNWKQINRLYS